MGEFKDISKPIQRLRNRLPKHAQIFIDNTLFNHTPKTVYDYCKSLCLFYDYLSSITGKDVKDLDISIIDSLTTKDIRNFQDYISAGHNSIDKNRYKVPVGKEAASNKTSPVRQYFSFLKKAGLIDEDPTINLLPYKSSKKEFEGILIKEDEVQKLIKAITEVKSTSYHSKLAAMMTVKRDIAIVLLLYNLGLNRRELSELNISDVDLDNKTLRVIKKGTESLIPMDEKTASALKDYIENERDVLLRGKKETALLISLKSNRVNPETISIMLRKYGRNSELDEPVSIKKLNTEKKYIFYEE